MSVRTASFLLGIMGAGFFVVAQIYAMIPLLESVSTDYGLPLPRATLLASVFGFAFAAGFLVFGPLADRKDRLTLLVVGLAALSVATLGAAFAPSFDLLIVLRAVQGFAAASFPPSALAIISEKVSPRTRPLAIAMLGFAFLSSGPLSQLLVARTGVNFSAAMMAAAALYLAFSAILFLSGRVVGDVRPASQPPAARPAYTGTAHFRPAPHSRLVSSRAAYPSVAATMTAPVAVLFAFVSFHTTVQFLALSDASVSPQFIRMVGFPPLLLTFAAAPLMARFGPALTATTGLVVAGLGLALAPTAGLEIASVVLSAGLALTVPGLIATVSAWSSNAVRGRALAIYTFFLFAGASLAPPVANGLLDLNMSLAFAVPGVLSFLAAGLLFRAGRMRRRDLTPTRLKPRRANFP